MKEVLTFKLSCHMTWRRRWHPTPVLLPGKSQGRRSLVGCSPWGREEPDTTERLPFHFSLSCIGEGNGNPLQCSCLENPSNRWAWWAAIYGVAQSQARLKWLSSSSSSSVVLDFGLSDGCLVLLCSARCNGLWCWASFHVLLCHLYLFFGNLSLHIFCPFKNLVLCFLIVEF